jgi:CheY-like chemotaxis protein
MESTAKRVRCVDDDPATLKLRKFLLEAAGYKVYTADSAVDALAILAGSARRLAVSRFNCLHGQPFQNLEHPKRSSIRHTFCLEEIYATSRTIRRPEISRNG